MTLRRGAKGEFVKQLQAALNLKADGYFGPKTQRAVRAYQRANKLPTTGYTDDVMWLKLFGAPKKIKKIVVQPKRVEDKPTTSVATILNARMVKLAKLKGHVPEAILDELSKHAEIHTDERIAHFLGQCDHESGGFKRTTENMNYSASRLKQVFRKYFPGDLASEYANNPAKIGSRVYADRMGNGNEASGEGYKFRGRGYIQLTGKNNYREFGEAYKADVLEHPELVSSEYALTSAVFFFNKANVWRAADKGVDQRDIKAVTRIINGGTNGLNDRVALTNQYYQLLTK